MASDIIRCKTLGPHGINGFPFQVLCNIRYTFLSILYLLSRRLSFHRVVVVDNTRNLDDAHHTEEEVHCCETVVALIISCMILYTEMVIVRWRENNAYRIFLGLMIKHHRVQISPVAVRAAFCVRESFSAGR